MDVFELLSYKLAHFLNVRPRPRTLGAVFYEEDEPALHSAAIRMRDGTALFVSRWQDLFCERAFAAAMSRRGFSEDDRYAVLLVLSRFGYLLQIDNRQRTNKDYFVFFYLLQLIGLKNGALDADARIRNHMLRFLLFELSIDDAAYRRFGIEGGRMVMATDALGTLPVLDVIEQVYAAIGAERSQEHAALRVLRACQTGIVRLLAESDGVRHRFALDDRLGELVYPDVFLPAYVQDRTRIFDALADTLHPLQSTENLFVSNMILMNYSFYVLKDRPGEICELQRHFDDPPLFARLLEALLRRRMAVDKALFATLPLGLDLGAIRDDAGAFYNILYAS